MTEHPTGYYLSDNSTQWDPVFLVEQRFFYQLYRRNFESCDSILSRGVRPLPSKKGVFITLNCIWWWDSSSVGLESGNYFFFASPIGSPDCISAEE